MMTQRSQDEFFSFIPASPAPVHRFRHEAMATIFEIFIVHDDGHYAAQAAWAAFDELDGLERKLSRFIENSDISEINNLAADQALQLGLDAFRCLRLSAEVYEATNGAFDVTIGSLSSCRLAEDKSLRKPSSEDFDFARRRTGMNLLTLDEASHTVTLSTSGVQIDLGGVGKGYAVDRMAELLADWSVDTALICAGQSSVLALGSPPKLEGWPVKLTKPSNTGQILDRFFLRDEAMSGSGLQKGYHIIDTRITSPVKDKRAAWALAPDAGTADALSTAFMVMSPDEIKNYCRQHPDVSAMIILQDEDTKTQEGRVLCFGPWKTNNPPG